MAALPYIQLYVADYLADTMHLSTEEHGAYLLLIFNYWQTGKPIPKSRLARIARLSNDRWISVESSLNEFFTDTGTEWVHERIERDLDSVHEAQAQRSAAGKASAEARKAKKEAKEQREFNGRSTVVENPLNDNSTNKDTDTDTDKKKIKDIAAPKPARKKFTPPDVIPNELWDAYLKSRKQKKHPMTPEALQLCVEAIVRVSADYPVEAILREMIGSGWRTVKAEWMANASSDPVNRHDLSKVDFGKGSVVRDF